MKRCSITITTTADGRETQIVKNGEMSVSGLSVALSYREDNAEVSISLYKEEARMTRKGDYDLSLSLYSGKEGRGFIGLGGSQGEIATYAHKIVYSVSESSLLASLRYDLIINGEKQEISLRVYAKVL